VFKGERLANERMLNRVKVRKMEALSQQILLSSINCLNF
jgi:hypothetical protein